MFKRHQGQTWVCCVVALFLMVLLIWENIQQERPGFFQKLGELTGQCCCRQAFFDLFCGQWGGPARLETSWNEDWAKLGEVYPLLMLELRFFWSKSGASCKAALAAALMTVKCQKEAAMCEFASVLKWGHGRNILKWNEDEILVDMQYRIIIFKRDLLFETIWTWTPFVCFFYLGHPASATPYIYSFFQACATAKAAHCCLPQQNGQQTELIELLCRTVKHVHCQVKFQEIDGLMRSKGDWGRSPV